MRQRTIQITAMRRELGFTSYHLKNNPDDPEMRARKDKAQTQIIELLADEVADLSRDLESVRATANCYRYRYG